MATASITVAVAAIVTLVFHAPASLHACGLQQQKASLRAVKQRGTPGAHNCTERYFDEQKLDHFAYRSEAGTTWSQRYLIYAGYWKPEEGPVFLYGAATYQWQLTHWANMGHAMRLRHQCSPALLVNWYSLPAVGNEGAVEAYADNTGLMWELGAQLNALLVFAEVRASCTSFALSLQP